MSDQEVVIPIPPSPLERARPYAIEALRELAVVLTEDERDLWIRAVSQAVVASNEQDPDFYDCPRCESEQQKTNALDSDLTKLVTERDALKAEVERLQHAAKR